MSFEFFRCHSPSGFKIAFIGSQKISSQMEKERKKNLHKKYVHFLAINDKQTSNVKHMSAIRSSISVLLLLLLLSVSVSLKSFNKKSNFMPSTESIWNITNDNTLKNIKKKLKLSFYYHNKKSLEHKRPLTNEYKWIFSPLDVHIC